MTKSLSKVLVLAAVFVALFAFPAYAQVSIIDYVGWGWETGGFPVSNVGDEMHFAGITSYLDPEFEIDLGVDELTLYVYGLISADLRTTQSNLKGRLTACGSRRVSGGCCPVGVVNHRPGCSG